MLKTCLAAALCFVAHTHMAAAQECSSDTPCTIPDGDYYIALPDAPAIPMPAVVFLHGYGGSPAGVMQNAP